MTRIVTPYTPGRGARQGSSEILTLPEAAAYLRVGRTTFRRLLVRGTAPAGFFIGARRLFRRADLDRYVEARVREMDRALAPVRGMR